MSEGERKAYQIRAATSRFETRSDEDGKLYISGYFAVFNSEYEIWPGAVEIIAETAFDEALSADIRCLIDHDTRLVVGRNKAATLTLKVDSRGLFGDVEINQKDQDAMNLYARVQRGDVDQCSFGFDIIDEEFQDLGETVRWIIRKVKLYEVSIVTFPAYEETSVTARRRELGEIRKRKIEAWKQRTLKKLKGEE